MVYCFRYNEEENGRGACYWGCQIFIILCRDARCTCSVGYVSTNGCCSCGPNTPRSWVCCLGDRLQNRMPLPETRFPILEVVNRVSVWFRFCSCFDAHYMPAKSWNRQRVACMTRGKGWLTAFYVDKSVQNNLAEGRIAAAPPSLHSLHTLQ